MGTDVCYGSDGRQVAMGQLFCIVLRMTFPVAGGERLVSLASLQKRGRALKSSASASGTPLCSISGCSRGGELQKEMQEFVQEMVEDWTTSIPDPRAVRLCMFVNNRETGRFTSL